MKILYAIQGTGNGHISRAREIIPYLKKHGELDLLISGTQAEVALQDEVKYQFKGFGFDFGTKGGIDFKSSIRKANFAELMKDVKKLPVNQYDLIINDFEPVAAWACKLAKKDSISLSHQSAYLSPKTPQIEGHQYGKLIMKYYAPTKNHIAFHFQKYDDFIHTPIIRKEIRNTIVQNFGHFTVYLPAYSDEFILEQTQKIPNSRWQIFSKHSKIAYETDHAQIFPVENQKFNQSLASGAGLLTGGGFEGPAEALFLGKKVLSVPMNHQFEQQCNALALDKMGIPVIWNAQEFSEKLRDWVDSELPISVDYPDETEIIIENLVHRMVK